MVTNQVFLSFIFIVNGIVIGLLFDFFRILRKTFKTKDIVTYIQDILFWILTGIILLYSIFTFNNGEIRLFMFLAIMIGISIYMLIFSSYIIKINVTMINLIKNIISKALPTGLTAVINIFSLALLKKYSIIAEEYFSSLCVISTGICGLMLLLTFIPTKKSEDTKLPFSIYRLVLEIIMILIFVIGLTVFRFFFNIVPLSNISFTVIRILIISTINFVILNCKNKKV